LQGGGFGESLKTARPEPSNPTCFKKEVN